MAKRTFPPRLITIHGTWDTAEHESGDLWWQRDGLLHKKLREGRVWGDHSLSPDLVYPFFWGGENSEVSRLNAARRLSTFLIQHALIFDLHIVAHSHGGNVLRAALSGLREAGYEGHRKAIRSITTVGAPFFVYERERSTTFYLGMTALGVALFVAAAMVLASAILDIAVPAITPPQLLILLAKLALMVWLGGAGYMLSIVSPMQLNSVKNQRDAPGLFCDWACIHSKSDEALIALGSVRKSLQLNTDKKPRPQLLVTGLDLQYFSVGVLVVSAMAALSVGIAFWPLTFVPASAHPVIMLIPLSLGAGVAAVLIWQILHRNLIQRCAQRASVLAATIRGAITRVLNQIANRQIAAAAFGDDCNAGIAGVSIKPWPDVGIPIVCAGDLHISLEQQVLSSFSDTLGRVRAKLSVEDGKAVDLSSFRSLLSWNELAHTTYFKNDDFLAMLCDRLENAQSVAIKPSAPVAPSINDG